MIMKDGNGIGDMSSIAIPDIIHRMEKQTAKSLFGILHQ